MLVGAQAQQVRILGRFADLSLREVEDGPVEAFLEEEDLFPEVGVAGGGAAAPLAAGETATRLRDRGGGGGDVRGPGSVRASAAGGRCSGSTAGAPRRSGRG